MCENTSISLLSILDGEYVEAVLEIAGKAETLRIECEPFTELDEVHIDSAKWSDGTEAAAFVAAHRREITKVLIDALEKAVAPV